MAERMKDRAERRGANRGEWFARLDTDKSGGISQAELAAARGARDDHAGMRRGGHRMGAMGGAGMGRGMGMLAMADANKDGAVTRAEATAAALAHFDRVDADKDGSISAEERRAAMQAMHARRGAAPAAPADADHDHD